MCEVVGCTKFFVFENSLGGVLDWKFLDIALNRSSHRRCSVKKSVIRNFAKFTEKHLCQRLFFNKVALNIFAKSSILDDPQGSECVPEAMIMLSIWIYVFHTAEFNQTRKEISIIFTFLACNKLLNCWLTIYRQFCGFILMSLCYHVGVLFTLLGSGFKYI